MLPTLHARLRLFRQPVVLASIWFMKMGEGMFSLVRPTVENRFKKKIDSQMSNDFRSNLPFNPYWPPTLYANYRYYNQSTQIPSQSSTSASLSGNPITSFLQFLHQLPRLIDNAAPISHQIVLSDNNPVRIVQTVSHVPNNPKPIIRR